MKRIAMVVRPPSDEAVLGELRAAVMALRRTATRIDVRLTFEGGDARRYARDAALGGCDVVVAAGGDGTVNQVANGLAAAGRHSEAAREVALAVVPIGTANDFARGIGLPLEIEAALRVAVEGVRAVMDVARVNRRCFVNVSTGGFGAEASQTASREAKKRLGGLAYVLRGAQKLVEFEPGRALFRADGMVVHDGEFVFFAVGNGSLTGGGTRIAPRADTGDGKMDVVLVRGVSRLDFLALLPDLRAGTHLESPDVSYFRAHTFEVLPEEPLRVNADGESIAGTAFRYDVVDAPLRVLVPG